MSFKLFKKYEKPFLWITVIFTVVVFATFSGFDDLRLLFGDDVSGGLVGEFTVATTGRTVRVGEAEFGQAWRTLGRFSRGADLDENSVWAHLMHVADAEGAGLRVPDEEVATQVRDFVRMASGSQAVTPAVYRSFVLQTMQFPSVRAFEEAVRRLLLAERWREVLVTAAGVVDADEVYKRWSVDNEVFDLQAVVFADLDPEAVPDPGDEVLSAWFDEIPVFVRDRQYAEPPRYDLVYGYLPFGEAFPELPEEIAGALEEPDEDAVATRFERVRVLRFPDATALDDETAATLQAELRLVGLATAAFGAYQQHEDAGKEAFVETMERHGLRVEDPEGLLGPAELEALPHIGSARLPLQVRSMQAGTARDLPALAADDAAARVVFVEEVQPERPLSFEEAREQVLAAWRRERVSRPAEEFRDRLREAARALPEAQEAIAPLLVSAEEAAQARIDAAEAPLDEQAQEAIRAEERQALEADVDARLAPFEGRVWDEVVAALGEPDLRHYTGVSRNRQREFGEQGADPQSLDDFLRSSFQVFQQDVGGVTDVLRHGASASSAVVRVTDRRMLPQSEMLADEQGMARARQSRVQARQFEVYGQLSPENVVAEHGLRVPQRVEPEPR